MKDHDRTRVRAIATAGLTVILVFGWLGTQSAIGFLNPSDEFFTAERSREMLRQGPWAVRNNFEVIGLKPPLQYWLTTLTLPRFQNRELAVRIWPLIYGALTAALLGWLAFVVDPERPWLVPISVGLLLTCAIFLKETSRALLDSGLTFFAMLAIVSAQLARNRPAWWLGVGLACWLGALQKIPLIILVWLIIIAVRLGTPGERRTLRSGWLLVAVAATALALAVWPLIQMLQFQLSFADFFRLSEVIDLTVRRAARIYLEIPCRLTTAWPCGVFALAAAASLPFITTAKHRSPIVELSVICLAWLTLSVVSNLRNVRYILPIIPCLCLLLALFLYWMLEQRKRIYTVFAVIITVLAMAGIVIAQCIINHDRLDLSDEVRMARELGARQAPTKRLLIVEGRNRLQREEFYLFYGDLKFPLTNFTLAQICQSPPVPPLLGICHIRDLPIIQKQFPGLQIQSAIGQFVCWEVAGSLSDSSNYP